MCNGKPPCYTSFVELLTATDADLVRSIMAFPAGSAMEAEGELCRRMAPRLRLYGLRHLRNDQAAADLMQHVLIVMLESVRTGRVKEPEQIASFVLGACRMAVLDMRRGAQRREGLLHEYARMHVPEYVEPLEPLDSVRLNDCLQRLGERERSVVVLTFYQEESSEAVAETLGLTSANARVIRHRALGRLRDCMTRAA
jgi:RNA polymerase sigma-70 factor, ECF subfamily